MKHWLVAISLMTLAAGCAGSASRPQEQTVSNLNDLPHLGELRSQVVSRLAQHKIQYDSPLTFYSFLAGAQSIRVSLMYAEGSDGSEYVSQINVRSNNIEEPSNTTLNGLTKQLLLAALLPDRRAERIRSQSAAVRDDLSGLKEGETAALFSSKRVAHAVFQRRIWDMDSQRWSNTPCRRAAPGLIYFYSLSNSEGIGRLMFQSEYLGECMKQSLN
jgi:hypothetical protein